MAIHNLIGNEGEQAARDFLITRGLIVRETNWRMRRLEIDIIAEEQDILHIIEVKTRDADNIDDFDPMRAVDVAKQRRLINAANVYVDIHEIDYDVQYDVMIIAHDKHLGTYDIDFIPNAFYPQLRTK